MTEILSMFSPYLFGETDDFLPTFWQDWLLFQVTSIVLTANYQIVNSVVKWLQMFYLIELNQEVNSLVALQVFMWRLYREVKSLGKCPDAGVDIRDFIFVFHGYRFTDFQFANRKFLMFYPRNQWYMTCDVLSSIYQFAICEFSIAY